MLEIRNPKSETISNRESAMGQTRCGRAQFPVFPFRYWGLFRISDFGFRISNDWPHFIHRLIWVRPLLDAPLHASHDSRRCAQKIARSPTRLVAGGSFAPAI